MLTQQDLSAIKDLLSGLEERLEKRMDGKFEEQAEAFENRIEEANLEIQKEITLLKAEMKREFRRVHNDQNLIIKHFNEEYLKLQERVENLEQKSRPLN